MRQLATRCSNGFKTLSINDITQIFQFFDLPPTRPTLVNPVKPRKSPQIAFFVPPSHPLWDDVIHRWSHTFLAQSTPFIWEAIWGRKNKKSAEINECHLVWILWTKILSYPLVRANFNTYLISSDDRTKNILSTSFAFNLVTSSTNNYKELYWK